MLSNQELAEDSSTHRHAPAKSPDLPHEATSHALQNVELRGDMRPPLNSCNDTRQVIYMTQDESYSQHSQPRHRGTDRQSIIL